MTRWLRAAEAALVVVALVCLGWYAAGHVAMARDRAAGLGALDEDLLERWAPGSGPAPAGSRGGAVAGGSGPGTSLPAGTVVGTLEVPRLGLSAVARSGDDDETLSRAVGHLPDTPLPGQGGNAAIAGHRDTHFRPIRRIRVGDEIVVTTPTGRYEYIVRDTRVVAPTDLSVLAPTGEPTLTLITCHPFDYIGPAPDRFIVRATSRRLSD
jgi:sortase A